MTQYLREQQLLRQQLKQQRQTQLLIKQKEEAMMKSIKQIKCRTLRHCRNKEKSCMQCRHNDALCNPYLPDYFVPLVPGLTVLP